MPENQDRSSNIESNDQPPSDSEPIEQEADPDERHVSSPTETDSPTLSYNGSDEKTDSPHQDIKSPVPQPPKEDERAQNSINDVDGSSQPTSTHSPPLPPQQRAEPSSVNALDEDTSPLKAEKKPKPKAPRKIRGRRKGRTQSNFSVKDDAKDKPTFTPRPELICRQASWEWEVVLSANDECGIKEVQYNGKSLEIVNGECRLSSLTGRLSISCENRDPDQLPLFDGEPLIFKLRKDWKGNGRKVKGITRGHFIVIAPKKWTRTGHVPVEQGDCTDPNFAAHYFYRQKDESTDDVGGFEGYDLALTTSRFELSGVHVFDDSEDGNLFVGAPPRLVPASCIIWARVGDEGNGGWKGKNFKPAENSLADVLDGRQGRFYIRVYGGQNDFDSGEFRYFRSLREILVNGEPYSEDTLLTPPEKGHPPTTVRFIGVDGVPLHPILPPEAVTTVDGKDSLIANPHPDEDRISCALQSGANHVDIVINLSRIWWRMEEDDGETADWGDRPLEMTRQEFRERSDLEAVIQLRLPLRISSVKVGFDQEINLPYRPNKNGNYNEIEIPLFYFIDYDQIDQPLHEDAFLNVQIGKEVITLIRVLADPSPTIVSFVADLPEIAPGECTILRWTTRNAEDARLEIDPKVGPVKEKGSQEVTPYESTTYTLRLMVSGKELAMKSLKVTVRTALEPVDERPAQVDRNVLTGNIYKTTIILNTRAQDKPAHELIEDVKNTLATMDEVQVVETVDLGRRDFGHYFLLTVEAPTSFPKKVMVKFCLDNTVYRILFYYGA